MERKMSNKLKRKTKSSTCPMNVTNFTLNQISDLTKCRIDSLKFWCEAREKEFEDIYQKEAQEKLEKAEDYIAVANILITLVAIRIKLEFDSMDINKEFGFGE